MDFKRPINVCSQQPRLPSELQYGWKRSEPQLAMRGCGQYWLRSEQEVLTRARMPVIVAIAAIVAGRVAMLICVATEPRHSANRAASAQFLTALAAVTSIRPPRPIAAVQRGPCRVTPSVMRSVAIIEFGPPPSRWCDGAALMTDGEIVR